MNRKTYKSLVGAWLSASLAGIVIAVAGGSPAAAGPTVCEPLEHDWRITHVESRPTINLANRIVIGQGQTGKQAVEVAVQEVSAFEWGASVGVSGEFQAWVFSKVTVQVGFNFKKSTSTTTTTKTTREINFTEIGEYIAFEGVANVEASFEEWTCNSSGTVLSKRSSGNFKSFSTLSEMGGVKCPRPGYTPVFDTLMQKQAATLCDNSTFYSPIGPGSAGGCTTQVCNPLYFQPISYNPGANPGPTPPVNRTDLSGDGKADLTIRRISDSNLYLNQGNGSGGWGPTNQQIGNGWADADLLTAPGDFTGDGKNDLIFRRPSNNNLYVIPGNGASGWLTQPYQIGNGWADTELLTSPGDFDGDGESDLIFRRPSDKHLTSSPGTAREDGTRSPSRSATTGPTWTCWWPHRTSPAMASPTCSTAVPVTRTSTWFGATAPVAGSTVRASRSAPDGTTPT
ncbi:hypothetical protein F4553_001440 [Allocatelliglobosispora scoriae]|uniref:VCBS repeat-containing protein n=1 Tax=Allocatelliglobosispora scoriae TaxID=643052 RepID=A0A841BMI6_9ACTN|nr:VCBS repeat-containing protein [Allocatelliglobosispora scoriae]MBB5868061.1 hypothetical protein [Allocatelliglobosispora scoriae]